MGEAIANRVKDLIILDILRENFSDYLSTATLCKVWAEIDVIIVT